MSWLDFIALTLAASAIVDVWRNGSLFADWRAFLEDFGDRTETSAVLESGEKLPFLMRLADSWLPNWVAAMLSCAFCFSYHAPWVVALVCLFPATLVPYDWLAFLLKLPVYALAATRLGNLINAWAPAGAKYEHD